MTVPYIVKDLAFFLTPFLFFFLGVVYHELAHYLAARSVDGEAEINWLNLSCTYEVSHEWELWVRFAPFLMGAAACVASVPFVAVAYVFTGWWTWMVFWLSLTWLPLVLWGFPNDFKQPLRR